MVRKRNLSDLLRDEAESLEPKSDAMPAGEQTIDISAEVADDTPDTTRRSHPPTKADLQAIVTDLKRELDDLRDRNQQLQTQITELEANAQRDSQKQQAQIKQLQAELEERSHLEGDLAEVQQQLEAEQTQSTQLKTELEAAKAMILKLSEANSKPEAKPPEAKPATPQRTPLQARPLPQRSSAIQPARPAMPARPVVPARPIEPNAIPRMSSESDTRLSDADIGWVD